MQGKNAIIKSSVVIWSNKLTPPRIGFFYLCKEVSHMVCLSEVVLYVVVLGRNPHLNKLLLERP